ncbi:MAG: TetR/AcrR family transcriptional regulator [Christensenellales bacterium]|jgi:AcrR family transcriptional regulator
MKKNDVRIERTKEWLYSALVELLKSHRYEDINVSDLTRKAGVARQTFYNNYACIDDIIVEQVQKVFLEYYNRCIQETTVEDAIRDFWDVCNRNVELFNVVEKTGKQFDVIKEFTRILEKITRSRNSEPSPFPNLTALPQEQIGIVSHLLGGGIASYFQMYYKEQKRMPSLGELKPLIRIVKLFQQEEPSFA